jgi:hypothetical protein
MKFSFLASWQIHRNFAMTKLSGKSMDHTAPHHRVNAVCPNCTTSSREVFQREQMMCQQVLASSKQLRQTRKQKMATRTRQMQDEQHFIAIREKVADVNIVYSQSRGATSQKRTLIRTAKESVRAHQACTHLIAYLHTSTRSTMAARISSTVELGTICLA